MSNLLALAEACDASDDAIVARVLDGDSRLFAALAWRHHQPLYRAVRAIMRDDGEAEDALEQTFVSGYRHLRAALGGSLLRWMLTVAIDEARARHCRRLRFEAVRREMRHAELFPPVSRTVAIVQPDTQRIEAAVDELPEAYRLVLVLRDVSDMSTTQVADVLEVKDANVRVRLFRAREALRRNFGEMPAVETIYSFGGRRAERLVLSAMHEIFSETAVPSRFPDAG